MKFNPIVLALSLAFTSAAFAQNPTTSGELLIAPEVYPTGSVLSQDAVKSHENLPNDYAVDRPVPAGLHPDASSLRRDRENDLNINTPDVPLYQTRPGFGEIDRPVPLGAHDNAYRPASANGYYDNSIPDEQRGPTIAPSIAPAPAPLDPLRPIFPPGIDNYPRPD